MKKSAIFFIILVFLISCLYKFSKGQVPDSPPEGFTYQAEARDGNGNVLAQQNLTVRIIIFQDDIGGTIVWNETQKVTTNDYGLFTIVIGKGPSKFVFSQINWGQHSHYLNVSIKRFEDQNWINMGTTQLLSVPYALHAKTVQSLESNPYIKQLEERINQIEQDPNVGTFKDSRDGTTYKWVRIGRQVWMAENLAIEINSNSIPYNGDRNNKAIYGLLYTWQEATTACPEGWHLPTDDEWHILEMNLGTSQSESSEVNGDPDLFLDPGFGWYGTDNGTKLKAIGGWMDDEGSPILDTETSEIIGYASGNGTDLVGFSALPGGRSDNDYNFDNIGYMGYWWSNTSYYFPSPSSGHIVNTAWYRTLSFISSQIGRGFWHQEGLLSVRCVKDD